MGLISHFPAHCAIVYLRGFASHCVTTHSFWSREAEVILQTAIIFKGLDGGGDDAKQDREAHTKKCLSDKLEIPWRPVLWHGYTITDTFPKQWLWWVPLDNLPEKKSEKQGVTYLCVHTGLLGHLLRAEIPQNSIGGKLHKFVGTSLGAQVNGRLGPPLLCPPIFGEAGYFNYLSFVHVKRERGLWLQ